VTFTADLGQGEELEPARKKAEMLGIKPRTSTSRTCARNSCATSSSRCSAPMRSTRALPARHLHRPAADLQAAGRDRRRNRRRRRQPRRDRQGQRPGPLRARRLCAQPDIKVIAPWRDWDLTSRTKLIEFAEQNQIPIAKDKRGEAPFSVDANLLHTSSEGKVLEDPGRGSARLRLPAHGFPEDAPDSPRSSRSASRRATPWRSTARRCPRDA
jgi:argininosuccinate synthase